MAKARSGEVGPTLKMSSDTGWWQLAKLVVLDRLKYNDSPILSGRNPRLQISPVAFSDGARGVVLHHSTCFPVAMARGANQRRLHSPVIS